jgi:beta-phosphoglucomutase-like phosphatase (HAD superfamily)
MKTMIFDFDGVIADTMKDNCLAWKNAFANYNHILNDSEYYRLEGMGRFQIAQHFIEKYNLDPLIKSNVVQEKELYYNSNNSFKFYDNIPEIFAFLESKLVKTAIVTGASRERIHRYLSKKILTFISALITADDIEKSKPHPEPYLKAINQLGVEAKDCIVVENSILGIIAAKKAGCKCFALQTTLDAKDLKDADEIFYTHKDLLERLKIQFI